MTVSDRHRVKHGLDRWTVGPLDLFLDYFLDYFFRCYCEGGVGPLLCLTNDVSPGCEPISVHYGPPNGPKIKYLSWLHFIWLFHFTRHKYCLRQSTLTQNSVDDTKLGRWQNSIDGTKLGRWHKTRSMAQNSVDDILTRACNLNAWDWFCPFLCLLRLRK